jgi:hypothetical protein
MNEQSDKTLESCRQFRPLAFALAAAMIWIPWADWLAGACNVIGCVAAFVVLGRIAEMNPRFKRAGAWLLASAFFRLIDAIYSLARGSWVLLYIHGNPVKMPFTMHAGDFLLGAAIWLIAGGLIELASAGRNIELRDSIASRRDLFLLFLVIEGLVIGPLTLSAYRLGVIDWNLLRLAFGFVAVFKLIVMILWALLVLRCAKGFESKDILL